MASNMADNEEAMQKAKLQLDFVSKADIAKLASLETPPPLVLLALQAAAGVVGLLAGPPQELTWEQLMPLLADAKSFISSLLNYDADAKPGDATEALKPFVEREDFRPDCLGILSGTCADICAWCLAVYVYGGGQTPPPAPEAALAKLRQERTQATAAKEGRPKEENAEEEDFPEEEEETPEEEQDPTENAGGLRVTAMSGELITTLQKARAEWIRADVRAALKKACPEHAGNSDNSHVWDVIVGNDRLKGKTSLGDLGLDPRSPEGAEVQAIAKQWIVPDDVHTALSKAREALNCLKKADLTELKAMKMPPALAEDAVTATYLVLHPKTKPSDMNWDRCKAMLGKPDFLARMLNFDLDKHPDIVVEVLEPFVSREDFNRETCARASLAAASLCQWVLGVNAYCSIWNEAIEA